ncbi:hypothetical protein GCM10007382_04310 [Salinibacterium xinjiangense]|uniref:DUF4190 domain-containing protein n=1 Tax=Salinibacterium xinjiangense TaxID=386302 RepID=A0A2C8ZLJ6_9MICO|nr:hypothetical protein [Salinibacterium xinjiangense]GGK87549.1 hypothetical protein GCM10007382_04310 [Salinibacterium xinjiangense]SOE65761.1 hypothetical protein SAMN06296378_1614 [Salinibacterium xinjiangense]
MSGNTHPEPLAPAEPTPTLVDIAPSKRPSRLSLVALIVGIVAFVCAIIPGLSFFAFLPAFAALGLGIAALAMKAPGRGKAIAGLALGPVALTSAIIVSVAAIAGGVAPTVDQAKPQPLVETSTPAAPATQTPTPQAAEKEGTRSNPAPAGSAVEISDNSGAIWQVQIGATNLNAGDVVAAENQFNDAADAGFQYILVPVTYTYVGTESGTPWLDVTIEFVSAAGTTHTNAYVVIPNNHNDINEMYTGASATGNVVIMAPSADIEKGAFTISTLFGSPYFVKVV